MPNSPHPHPPQKNALAANTGRVFCISLVMQPGILLLMVVVEFNPFEKYAFVKLEYFPIWNHYLVMFDSEMEYCRLRMSTVDNDLARFLG